MRQFLRSLLGDRPVYLFIKLLIASLLLGFILSVFDVAPRDIASYLRNLSRKIFTSLDELTDMMLLGALVVIPVFVLMRLFNRNKN